MPIKPLAFKGDPKKKSSKKRKAESDIDTTTTSQHSLSHHPSTDTAATAQTDQDQDSTWLTADRPSDISGPLLLVLPTHPSAGALSCDDLGSVFVSPLHNVVRHEGQGEGGEGTSTMSMRLMAHTAEPDDVRQVWVARRVGEEGREGRAKKGVGGDEQKQQQQQTKEVLVCFKGVNGRYLGCSGHNGDGDDDGSRILKAEAVAVGSEETFCISMPTGADDENGNENENAGAFLIATAGLPAGADGDEKTKKSTRYITVYRDEKKKKTTTTGWQVTARRQGNTSSSEQPQQQQATETETGTGRSLSSSSSSSSSLLYIRMQARFKPHFKANKEMKAKERISRRELEAAVGRRLDDEEVKRLKRARRHGSYYEEVLDVRVKGKHDKFASC